MTAAPGSYDADQYEAIVLHTTSLLHILGEAIEVDTTFEYDVTDPAAVLIRFRSGNDTSIEWLLARDLLIDGLTAMSGIGDVVVWPGPDNSAMTCNMRLNSPTGNAVFELPAIHLRAFLDRSFELVPRHREVYDGNLDDELLTLLNGQQ